MTLKTVKAIEPVKKGASVADASLPPATMLLELALYDTYSYQGFAYLKDHPYKFLQRHAMKLLNEQDAGRPVWKMYQPRPSETRRRVVEDVAPEAVDRTGEEEKIEPVMEDPIHGVDVIPERAIQIGDDAEISDLLPKDEEGNVIV